MWIEANDDTKEWVDRWAENCCKLKKQRELPKGFGFEEWVPRSEVKSPKCCEEVQYN